MPILAFRHSLIAAATGLLLLALSPAPSLAVIDTPAPPKRCSQYKEGSADWKRCMAQKQLMDDAEAFSAGYWLAKTGEFAAALDVLRSVRHQADPRVQTMIGFSLRQLGFVDEAMAYYAAALAANPDLTTTRQYLGEAFLQKSDRAGAIAQLAEIARRCGTTCEDYRLLAAAIDAA